MKNVFAVMLLFIIACNSSDKKEPLSMPGAYKMLSQSAKGGKTDTTNTSLQQLKIYTEDFMMYANVNSPDSVSSFGIASYSVNMDTVIENVFYSASDTSKSESPQKYNLSIIKTEKGYKQQIPNMQFGSDTITLTEDYESVGTAAKSALDGAWKQVKRFGVKGKDTTVSSGVVEYKTYFMGHIIWGNTWSDSLNKNHTGIGFGKFEMTGNKVKESMISSTYSSVRGHDFDIDIELNGTDGFTQTMKYSDSTITVEVYTRLKKQ